MNNSVITQKQKEFIKYGNKPYNVKTGARGGGKTHIDILMNIGLRVATLKKYKGMFIMCGNTLESIDDNILKPMRELWGKKCIPDRSKNQTEIKLFGKEFRLIGASSSDRVNVIRGKNILYAYCDEVATYVEEFFDMLITGLRCGDENGKLVSVADFTCNPESPTHWFKSFIDNQITNSPDNIYYQHYTMDDNPFLPEQFRENMKMQYKGTVYYDRWILGKWVNAEGIIFRQFADNKDKYLLNSIDRIVEINIGVDFGGNKSKTIFVASAVCIINGAYRLVVLESKEVYVKFEGAGIDGSQVMKEHFEFYSMICNKYKIEPTLCFCDHLDLVLNQMINFYRSKQVRLKLGKVDKNTISLQEYVMTINSLFNLDKLYILNYNSIVIDSLSSLLYDDDKIEDTVLDDGTCDVDTYDAFRYSISNFLKNNKLYQWIVKQ